MLNVYYDSVYTYIRIIIPDPLSICSTENSEGDLVECSEPLSSADCAGPIKSFRLSSTYSDTDGACDDPEQWPVTEESRNVRHRSPTYNSRVCAHKNLTGPLAAGHRAETMESSDEEYKWFSNTQHHSINDRNVEEQMSQGNTESSKSDGEESDFSDSKGTFSSTSNVDYQMRVDEKQSNKSGSNGTSNCSSTVDPPNNEEKDYCDCVDDVRHSEGRRHHREEDDDSSPSSLNKFQQTRTMPKSTEGKGGRVDEKKSKPFQPIRGAAKGEAIGLKSQILNASFIPSCKKKLAEFIKSPLCVPGPNIVLRCFIERRRIGLNARTPEYCLYVDYGNENERLLLAARKILKSKTSHYIICGDRKDLYIRYGAIIIFILCRCCCCCFLRVRPLPHHGF